MSKQKKLITAVVVIAILLMGIGYANLSPTDLTIGGTASATAAQENFKVYYSGNYTPEDDDTVLVDVNNGDTDATVTISGLKTAGESKSAVIEIINDSNGIIAESVVVDAETVGTDSDYFDIDVAMCTADGTPTTVTNLAVGAPAYVKVTATLKVTPTTNVSTDIAATLTATPKAN